MTVHRVHVEPLPPWLACERWLGPGDFRFERRPDGDLRAVGELPTLQAADLSARLRGLGIAGRAVVAEIVPPLRRGVVREARLVDARRRRDTSVGFAEPRARFDREGRTFLTPEAIALKLGARAAGAAVLDAAAGLGGNAIGFARAGCDVIAVEIDAERLALARHNARVYGVAERIAFQRGDVVELLRDRSFARRAELLFVDPPWGEPYDRRHVDAATIPLLLRLLGVGGRFARVWAKLPPSLDEATLPREPTSIEAVFGVAEGDYRRIKFLLAEFSSRG